MTNQKTHFSTNYELISELIRHRHYEAMCVCICFSILALWSLSDIHNSTSLKIFMKGKFAFNKYIKTFHKRYKEKSFVNSIPAPIPNGFIVKSTQCIIPDYDPWDRTIWKILNDGKNHKQQPCLSPGIMKYPNLVTLEGRNLVVNQTFVEKLKHNKLECCVRDVYRNEIEEHDNVFHYENKFCINNGAYLVNGEFTKVECHTGQGINRTMVFQDFFAFIDRKNKVESRIRSIKNKIGNRTNREEPLNVYFVGVDSVSRLNFLRYMPKVNKFLKQDLNALMLHGLVTVGLNTFPNYMGMFCGSQVKEVPDGMVNGDEPFDKLDIIWNWFSLLGYRTMLNKDRPFYSAFNFKKIGFLRQPTDYYLRTLYLPIERRGSIMNIYHTKCINRRSEIEFQLDWLQQFMSTFSADELQFALMMSSAFTHSTDPQNVLNIELPFLKFLKWYSQSERFNNSIMFFFSDHGQRIGRILSTELGAFESRMPYVWMILPPWYKSKYPHRYNNLLNNRYRLTTFHDVHATLVHLLENFGSDSTQLPATPYGISIFHPIPNNRSCATVGVDLEWCTCRQLTPLSTSNRMAKRFAYQAMDHIKLSNAKRIKITGFFNYSHPQYGAVTDTLFVHQPFKHYRVQFIIEKSLLEADIRQVEDGYTSVISVCNKTDVNSNCF